MRGVRADRQVLICPGCQSGGEWVTDLDRCALCASVHLVRRLGEVECRDCGAAGSDAAGGSEGSVVVDAGPTVVAPPASAPLPGLAEEVEQALARVLRRSASPA
ncbi:MAG TPA: hypothetical protein VN767_18265 [Streptosporangiaceae bacterium]|nr:hypothetical protein [Streptosporangiaceae bacterium]